MRTLTIIDFEISCQIAEMADTNCELKHSEMRWLLNNHKLLLKALQALGAKPIGYCFCVSAEQVEAGHTGECRDAQAAIAAAEGEA